MRRNELDLAFQSLHFHGIVHAHIVELIVGRGEP